MGDLLRSGVGWHLKKLKEGASLAMIYRRGALSVNVQVTRGRSEYQTYDDEGNLVTEVTDATFIMPADELTLAGSITKPVDGDRLEEVTGRGTRTYEVMSKGNRRPFALDASTQMLRIHTKLVKES